MNNRAHSALVDVVVSWYLRRWKVLRALAFVCVGLVSLVLVIVLGATLEGGSGVAFPLALSVALGAPSAWFARHAHRRVVGIDQHELVRALRERQADVAVVDRSTTIVQDLTLAGLFAGRKEHMPCLKLRVSPSGKRYLIPMTGEQCDAFTAWLAPAVAWVDVAPALAAGAPDRTAGVS